MSFTDGNCYGPTTQELNDAFVAEVDSLCGYVSDCYDDGDRLFMRAVLPLADDVAPGDRIHNGIAIRAAGSAVFVHPYTLRQVCTNGAVMAQATQSVRIERVAHNGVVVPTYDVVMTIARFAEAVRDCATPAAFAQSIDAMRGAMSTPLNVAINLGQILHRAPPGIARSVLNMVFREFENETRGDGTAFELANVVTATARETTDPEARWQLEELGGSLMADVGASRRSINEGSYPPMHETGREYRR